MIKKLTTKVNFKEGEMYKGLGLYKKNGCSGSMDDN